MDPLVVKMGGSLLESVPELVREIQESPQSSILVIPGGSLFADMVRNLAVPEEEAHWMAIVAMELYGWYISSKGLPITETIHLPPSPCVFLPYRSLREQDPLPHSWQVTSDTIAAWVASRLGAELVLLKSVDGLYQQGVLQERITKEFPCHEVDAAFLPFVLTHKVRCTVLNGSIPNRLRDFLRGAPIRSTRVETTF
jgi:aspartokinase-like uncharacterized kinase